MKGKSFFGITSLVLFEILLFTLCYFSPIIFSFGFGEKPQWYVYVIGFLRNKPFAFSNPDEISIWGIFLNTMFWTALLGFIFYYFFFKRPSV
jgi:hypothetical protein